MHSHRKTKTKQFFSVPGEFIVTNCMRLNLLLFTQQRKLTVGQKKKREIYFIKSLQGSVKGSYWPQALVCRVVFVLTLISTSDYQTSDIVKMSFSLSDSRWLPNNWLKFQRTRRCLNESEVTPQRKTIWSDSQLEKWPGNALVEVAQGPILGTKINTK